MEAVAGPYLSRCRRCCEGVALERLRFSVRLGGAAHGVEHNRGLVRRSTPGGPLLGRTRAVAVDGGIAVRDRDLVIRAQLAASALEGAWHRWRAEYGHMADPVPAVSSYVGYS